MTPITVILDNFRTVPEANMAEHWRHRHTRARYQRHLVYISLRHHLVSPQTLDWPLIITMTRVGAPAPR